MSISSFRVQDGIQKENAILRADVAYYRRALKMIAKTLPFEVLSDPTFRAMGTIFGQRMQIAQRALRGERPDERAHGASCSCVRMCAAQNQDAHGGH